MNVLKYVKWQTIVSFKVLIFLVWMALEMPESIPYVIVWIFIKSGKQRLNYQFIQEWNRSAFPLKILSYHNTERCSSICEINTCLPTINSSDKRNIYTRLRIKMAVLSTSHSCKNTKDICFPGDTGRYIILSLKCSPLWDKLYKNVYPNSPGLNYKSVIIPLPYILTKPPVLFCPQNKPVPY